MKILVWGRPHLILPDQLLQEHPTPSVLVWWLIITHTYSQMPSICSQAMIKTFPLLLPIKGNSSFLSFQIVLSKKPLSTHCSTPGMEALPHNEIVALNCMQPSNFSYFNPMLCALMYRHFREIPRHADFPERMWGAVSIMLPCCHFPICLHPTEVHHILSCFVHYVVSCPNPPAHFPCQASPLLSVFDWGSSFSLVSFP